MGMSGVSIGVGVDSYSQNRDYLEARKWMEYLTIVAKKD
jgi:hypothetical protein